MKEIREFKQRIRISFLGIVRHPVSAGFLLIMLSSLIVYILSKGPYVYQNHFVYLAEAFLKGRLGFSQPPSLLSTNELVYFNGNYYVVYPPMPAVLLIPFVAIFGTSFDQGILSIVIGSLAASMMWLMLKKTGVNDNKAIWLTVLFAFGTCFWYIAVVGSSWYIAHVSAVFFLTWAIVEALGKKRNFLTGFLVGCAYISRLPTVLSVPFFLLLNYDKDKGWKSWVKNSFYLCLGLLVPAGLNALYNYQRYGVLTDIGYFLIPGVLDEPWYNYGIFSINYIPREMYAILFQGPILLDQFPFFKPSWMGLGLFFTTPAFIYTFKGPWDKFSKISALAVLCILPPLITHGTVGFTQFGYRFSLDFTPFLLLLTSKGMRKELGKSEKSLMILSLLVNLWGIVSIIGFGFVGYS